VKLRLRFVFQIAQAAPIQRGGFDFRYVGSSAAAFSLVAVHH